MKRFPLFLLVSVMMLCLVACAPKLRLSSANGLITLGVTAVSFDDAEWDVTALTASALTGNTGYKAVKAGTSHDVTITVLTATKVDVTKDLQNGKKYTWKFTDNSPVQDDISED